MTEHPKVLIVEDNPYWRDILETYVAKTSFGGQAVVERAEHLSEAVRFLKGQVYDLVVIDLRLAEWADEESFGGMEVLKFLEECARGKHTQTIVISAYGKANHVRKAWKKYGVLDYFDKKHLEEDEVIRSMQRAIEKALSERRSSAPQVVLIVEDEPDWQDILRKPVQELGHQVEVVGKRRRALDEVDECLPDLAVLDLAFDRTDPQIHEGMEVLIKLVNESIPTIIVSGHGDVPLVDRMFREYGVLAFIDKKKYDPEEFKDIVGDVIGKGERPLDPEARKEVARLRDELLERVRQGKLIAS